jgi:ABC-type transport system involved in cytochrome c biogenesis permease component
MLHWLPVVLTAVVLFIFCVRGLSFNELWLYFMVAPFTVGTPALSLVVYKRWYAQFLRT